MSKQHPSILVVEDESLLLQAITRKLKVENITPISSASGDQALDHLKNMTELPDAIWLDYHLKDMDGLAFMTKLKENSAWMRIPVFVVSNSATDATVKRMLGLGAKQYFVKAENRLEELITTIKDYIQNDG